MKRRLLVALAGLAIGFAVPTLAQQKDTLDPQTAQKILATGPAWDRGANNHDATAIAALFSEDAVFGTTAGPVNGRQAIEKLFRDLYQGWHPSNHLIKFDGNAPHPLGTAGNEAWATGEWSETGQGPTGEPLPNKGYWLAIFVREGDDWKIRLSAANDTPDSVIRIARSFAPPPAAAPSPTASPSSP